jgi:ribonuclease VapC
MIERPPLIDLVIDTSAIVALLLDEATAGGIQRELENSSSPVISAASIVELSIVTTARFGPAGGDAAQAVLDAAGVVTVPVASQICDAATDAWRRLGRGNHPAGLNFGDCFAYATAKHYDVPLLCVGDDFKQTDLRLVDVGIHAKQR